MLSWNSPGVTEEYHLVLGLLLVWPTIELGTYQIQVLSVTATPACSVIFIPEDVCFGVFHVSPPPPPRNRHK
jgi:hypothetical protein